MEEGLAGAPARGAGMDVALERAGTAIARYGVVIVLLWIGGMKFTADEAQGIVVLVERSPLMSWVYGIWSVQGFSNVLGVVEIAIAAGIAARPVTPGVATIASALAALMFMTTLSFMFTTPGWDAKLGFPAINGAGQFLLKDLVLLGASVWTFGEAMSCVRSRRAR